MLGSKQMENFAIGLMAYAQGKEPPEGCYPGEHTKALALDLAKTVPIEWGISEWSHFASARIIGQQFSDLKAFGVVFDSVTRESTLHGGTCDYLRTLCALGKVYKIGLNDVPICGNCATKLEWIDEFQEEKCKVCGGGICKPCSFCTVTVHNEPYLVATRMLIKDPGLHPDNDFMPED